jgi:protein-disulfide isomerase
MDPDKRKSRALLGDVASVGLALVALAVVGTLIWRSRVASVPPRQGEPFGRFPVRDAAQLATTGNVLGDSEASFRIVEFSDFQCPFCRALHGTLQQLRARYPAELAVVYRQFPLSIHPFARDAAIASECAAAQGGFSEYADLIFAKHDSLGSLPWEVIAARAGITDTALFRECRRGKTATARVDADVAAGTQLAIPGTPALVIGDTMFVGALPFDTLESLLRRAGAVRP